MRKSILHRLLYYFSFSVSSFIAALGLGKIDVVFDISPPLVGTAIAMSLARIKGARFIYLNWDSYPEIALDTEIIRPGVMVNLIGRLDTFLGNHSTHVLVLADCLKKLLIRLGVRPEKILVLPIWTSVSDQPLSTRRNDWRLDQGIADDAFIALPNLTIWHAPSARRTRPENG